MNTKRKITEQELDDEVVRLAQQNGVDIEEVDREFVREKMESRQ